MPHPAHNCLSSSDVQARSAAGITEPLGREPESVDNTREKHAAVDNTRNPPVPQHTRQREVLLPAYLAPPGAQQGTAGSSSENGSGSCRGGTTWDHPSSRVTSTAVGSLTQVFEPGFHSTFPASTCRSVSSPRRSLNANNDV